MSSLPHAVLDPTVRAGVAQVTLIPFPVRALDTLEFDQLNALDLAFSATQNLVRDAEVTLAVAP